MDNEITIIKLYDPETDCEEEFELAATAEVGDVTYYLIADLYDEAETASEPEDDEPDEEELEAYIFKPCGKEEEEFEMTLDEQVFSITSAMSDEEYDAAAKAFIQKDDLDIELLPEEE